jgi:hypothetical protein
LLPSSVIFCGTATQENLGFGNIQNFDLIFLWFFRSLEDEVWEVRFHLDGKDNLERKLGKSYITYTNMLAMLEIRGYGQGFFLTLDCEAKAPQQFSLFKTYESLQYIQKKRRS